MAAKRRKRGDWEAVARARAKVQRDNRTGRGLTNIPNISDVGSAAYRRLVAKINRRGGER